MAYNIWLPGTKIYEYNDGVTREMISAQLKGGGEITAETFSIPNAQSGFGTTFDMASPPIQITKPPKVAYSSNANCDFVLKDADGWLWAAPMRAQSLVDERGWEWAQFSLAGTQENEGEAPSTPNTSGYIQAFQFQGAEGAHGTVSGGVITVTIAYMVGRTPVSATSGTIRKVTLTNKDDLAYTMGIGDAKLVDGTRREIKYYGSLPFGLMLGGPTRSSISTAPYRGPFIAGYQSGTPWVDLNNDAKLSNMLDFMLQSQLEFQERSPTNILGPFMHCYLPATWDSEQTGTLDTWVWDAPDGNPAWNGWQYRAIDSMGATWWECFQKGSTQTSKVATVCTRFLDWMYSWMLASPDANYIPSDWGPPGWTQGIPLEPSSYLVPHGTTQQPHDLGLVMKACIFSGKSGYDMDKAKYMVRRIVRALLTIQVPDTSSSPMRGCFTTDPTHFISYGFEQGEVHDALALALMNRDFLAGSGDDGGDEPPRETEDGETRILENGEVITPTPGVSLSPSSLSLTSVVNVTSTASTVTISNPGTATLVVFGITSDTSQFTIEATLPMTIPVGSSNTFLVKFTPTAVSTVSGSIAVSSNGPTRVLPVTGVGTSIVVPGPIINFPVSSFVFTGETVVGETSTPRTFTIQNTGTATLNIVGITLPTNFTRTSGATMSIAAGASGTISATFTPVVPGTTTGAMTFTSNAPNSPHTVPVTASGIADEVPVPELSYLRTQGRLLLDENDNEVMLRSINWYGFEQIFVPGGAWTRPFRTKVIANVVYEGMLDEIKRLGFNSLRILFSEDVTFAGSKPETRFGFWNTTFINVAYNGEFLNSDAEQNPQNVKTTAEILDIFVGWCEELGIRIVFDLHCLAPDDDNVLATNGRWYTTSVPSGTGGTSGTRREPRSESQAINAFVWLATRYANRPVVCGFDLINEPHNTTWDRDPLTGVVGYYERCGNAIHAANPNVLIICEGVAELGMNNGTVDHTPVGHEDDDESLQGFYKWGTVWSGKLDEVARIADMQVTLTIPHRVVYSPHEYFSWGGSAALIHQWFHPEEIVGPGYAGLPFPENMPSVWNRQWGYIAEEDIAPLWIGEFGSYYRVGGDPITGAGASYTQEQYDCDVAITTALAAYCDQYRIGYAFWAWNPGGNPDGLLEQQPAGTWRDAQQFKLDIIEGFLVPDSSGAISVTPATLDFGEVLVGSTSNKTLTFANVSSSSLAVTFSAASPYSLNKSIATITSGGTTTVVVTYAPSAETVNDGSITYAFDGHTKVLSVTGTGSEVPVLPGPIITPPVNAYGITAMGDSLTWGGFYDKNGWLSKTCFYDNQRLIDRGNFAVIGTTASDGLANQINSVLAMDPPVKACVVAFGTNQISDTISGTNQIKQLCDILVENNIYPVLWCVPPRNDMGTSMDAFIRSWNDIIRAYREENNFPMVDAWAALKEADSDRLNPACAQSDNLHINFYGYGVLGKAAVASEYWHIIPDDGVFPLPTTVGGGNIYPNPLMADSNSDGVSNGLTIPAGYTKSIITGDPGITGNWQRIVRPGGVTVSTDPTLQAMITVTGGTKYRIAARMRWTTNSIPDVLPPWSNGLVAFFTTVDFGFIEGGFQRLYGLPNLPTEEEGIFYTECVAPVGSTRLLFQMFHCATGIPDKSTDTTFDISQILIIAGNRPPNTPQPAASFPASSVAFGNQLVTTTSAPRNFIVNNAGNTPLSLTSIAVTTGFTRTSASSMTIAAGGSASINITFTPATIGAKTGTLTFVSNTTGSPHSFPLTGTGTATVGLLQSEDGTTRNLEDGSNRDLEN